MSILFSILIFSFLILIHELGHFAAAKAMGVQVNEFSMFMGPALWQKQVGKTLYSLRCIPFGGYCAMEGEDGISDSPHAFTRAAWWKRLIILVAGAAMNFLAGLLLLGIFYSPAKAFVVPEVAHIEPGCTIAGEAGIQVGDRLLRLDGERIYTASDFSMILTMNGGEYHDLVLQRQGKKVILNDFRMEKHPFPNEDGTESVRFGFDFGSVEATLPAKLSFTWNNARNVVRLVRLSLRMLLQGQAGLRDVSGPVGIVKEMSDVAEASSSAFWAFMNLLYFGGFIAINLAVMNLLPIPALDGGRAVGLLMTAAIEGITHRRINPKIEGYVHGAGMVCLLALMGLIMFKDIIFLFKG